MTVATITANFHKFRQNETAVFSAFFCLIVFQAITGTSFGILMIPFIGFAVMLALSALQRYRVNQDTAAQEAKVAREEISYDMSHWMAKVFALAFVSITDGHLTAEKQPGLLSREVMLKAGDDLTIKLTNYAIYAKIAGVHSTFHKVESQKDFYDLMQRVIERPPKNNKAKADNRNQGVNQQNFQQPKKLDYNQAKNASNPKNIVYYDIEPELDEDAERVFDTVYDTSKGKYYIQHR